jgi:hypothetical protein
MNWISIRKGVSVCHFEYDNFWTDLFVTTSEYRVMPHGFELSLDLNKNLHTNNKSENTYVDCLRLRSNVPSLTTVQVHDEAVAAAIEKRARPQQRVHTFRLKIVLDSDYWFEARATQGVEPFTIRLTPLNR